MNHFIINIDCSIKKLIIFLDHYLSALIAKSDFVPKKSIIFYSILNYKTQNKMKPFHILLKEILESMKHPFMDYLLIDLGILKNVEAMGDKILVNVAWPSAESAIKPFIISLVTGSLKKLDRKIEINESIMSDEDKKFYSKLVRKPRPLERE